MGMMEAILKLEGTEPDAREELIMFLMKGQRVGRQISTNTNKRSPDGS